jgi:hypothetical protein
MRTSYWARCLWLTCASGLFLSTGVRGEEPDPETEEMMIAIVQALRVVIPLSEPLGFPGPDRGLLFGS